MIRITLEKKDYDMKIRSFDTKFSCGSFYDILFFCVIFMSFFKVKILEKVSVFHSFHRFQPRRQPRLSYHMIWYHMISYHMISYDIISYDIMRYDMISYDMISYDMIAAADAAAETCETNGTPRLFQEKCPWNMTLFFWKLRFVC